MVVFSSPAVLVHVELSTLTRYLVCLGFFPDEDARPSKEIFLTNQHANECAEDAEGIETKETFDQEYARRQ